MEKAKKFTPNKTIESLVRLQKIAKDFEKEIKTLDRLVNGLRFPKAKI